MTKSSPTLYCSRCLTSFNDETASCPNLGCGRNKPTAGWGKLLQQGDVFDRTYRIKTKLAIGGAGVTYLAQELDEAGDMVGPDLAIKVLLSARDHGPFLQRLATEAGILRELNHGNIVECRGFVHRSGHTPYLVTRFERGGSLLDHLRRTGPLSLKVAAHIGRQVCWALSVAHKRDIIHRDLKPENVLLAEEVAADVEPVIRVADFGIAKVAGGLGSGLTRMGAFVGTPQYAAPEQFAGDQPTPKTDVYSVGALIYFCICSRPVVLFADRLSLEEGFDLLLRSLPPKVEFEEASPEEIGRLNRILAATMAVEATHRPTVDELDDYLGAFLAGREPNLKMPQAVITSSGGTRVPLPQVATLDQPETLPTQPDITAREAPPPNPHQQTMDPSSTPQEQAPAPKRRRKWPVVLAGLVALGFVGVVGLGLAVWQAPNLLPQLSMLNPGEPVVDLNADDSLAPLREQLEGVVVQRWASIREGCSLPPRTGYTLGLLINPDGTVGDAALGGANQWPDKQGCVEMAFEATNIQSEPPLTTTVRLGMVLP